MKVDFKKELDEYRARRGEFRIVDVPPLRYLMVDGHGDPNTAAEYADALSALYPVACRHGGLHLGAGQEPWDWTMMLLVPDWITSAMVDTAIARFAQRNDPASLDRVRLESLHEGRCVQTLHVGPYDDEAAVLATMHQEFLPESGLELTGKHHEIYLSDPRRVEPTRLRTILRQPVDAAQTGTV